MRNIDQQEENQVDESDSKSVHSFSAHTKKQSVDQDKDKDQKEQEKNTTKGKFSQQKKLSILTWPDTLLSQIIYVVLYPFHLLYWIIMPNIYHKPEIIKVLIGILFSFLIFIAYAFVLTKIQEDLIFNFAIKPHVAAIFNSLFYTLR